MPRPANNHHCSATIAPFAIGRLRESPLPNKARNALIIPSEIIDSMSSSKPIPRMGYLPALSNKGEDMSAQNDSEATVLRTRAVAKPTRLKPNDCPRLPRTVAHQMVASRTQGTALIASKRYIQHLNSRRTTPFDCNRRWACIAVASESPPIRKLLLV